MEPHMTQFYLKYCDALIELQQINNEVEQLRLNRMADLLNDFPLEDSNGIQQHELQD